MTTSLAGMVLAAQILGALPVVAEPAAMAQISANKPPGGADCVPGG
jgi:hypothetical protein